MKKILDTLFHPAKTKWFWAYIVFGILGIFIGIVLMPVWTNVEWAPWKTWGYDILNIIIFVCIVLYLCLFLIKKILTRTNGVIKVLTILEFVLLALVALGCILQQFKVITIANGACAIVGLALWCRGAVEIFRAYYHQRGNNDRYPVWWLAVSIAFVTLGVYLIVAHPIPDVYILWTFVILILLVSIILIVDGILAKPASRKTKKSKSK
ncbi:MAG: hypothetical protein K2N64_01850 [Anaeroplasmataceae bacterium]|nr:hypothetical protein [Anaeroplasmataceae bacterium]